MPWAALLIDSGARMPARACLWSMYGVEELDSRVSAGVTGDVMLGVGGRGTAKQ